MAETQRRRSSRHKIEPLNYAEAALSPALKGMTSFLDVSPENVRNQDFHSFGPVTELIPLVEQSSAVPVTYPGDETTPVLQTPRPSSSSAGHVEISSEDQSGLLPVTSPGDETTPVGQTSHPSFSRGRTPELISTGNRIEGSVTSQRGETSPGDETAPVAETSHAVALGSTITTPDGRISPQPETSPERVLAPRGVTGAEPISPAEDITPPGDETYVGDISTLEYELRPRASLADLTPGRGRSKIRRCVLAQDGHSLGEEAIYQVLWRTGRAENSDPNGSRTNRMGAADIGFKVNMAKKNVRQNISRLFEKLAIEILEDFETMNSQARLYRVYSYKQILERRRAAGLEYVLRNKGVVFCTQDGAELVSSPAYVSSPGGKTSIKPAPPKKRRVSPVPEPPKYPQTPSAAPRDGPSNSADLQVVSQALNRYWTVDEAAAVQLLRDCRRVCKDARADEIAFFVQEKLELSRNSRTITNPTGLILATVPQSFVGSAFEEFRRRMERHAKLEAEEAERKRQQEAELAAWIEKDRARYEAIVSDPTKSDIERDAAEKRLREISSWSN